MEESARSAVIKQRFTHPGETSEQDVWRRVAYHWSNTPGEVDEFFRMMDERRGFPNTPAIANAGKTLNMGSACFVLPIDDSVEGIMETAKKAAIVQKSGGGTGFSFGRIRPKGSIVESTGRPAPGPVSFLKLYSDIFSHITQAGLRPGANMGILPVDHPDILEFIQCKNDNSAVTNFNISVGVTDEFMRAVDAGDKDATHIWEAICINAHHNGEPGVVFLDTVNDARFHDEKFEATNPCGEVPLLPYEACVLGSVNVAAHMVGDELDWDIFEATVRTMTRLLDNIVDKQSYPLPIIEETHKRYRKIGVGVMGYADALIMKGLRYGSDEALLFAGDIMETVQQASYAESTRIAQQHKDPRDLSVTLRRNLCCQVIAPTGTISRLAGCSFGIEPNFAGEYTSFILGSQFKEEHPLRDNPHFVAAKDVTPAEHVKTQAVFQQWTDQAVSKTVNLPHTATVEDISNIYKLAWNLGCKGITVLREDSRDDVVLEDCPSGVCAL